MNRLGDWRPGEPRINSKNHASPHPPTIRQTTPQQSGRRATGDDSLAAASRFTRETRPSAQRIAHSTADRGTGNETSPATALGETRSESAVPTNVASKDAVSVIGRPGCPVRRIVWCVAGVWVLTGATFLVRHVLRHPRLVCGGTTREGSSTEV